jgi:hypothetical protein
VLDPRYSAKRLQRSLAGIEEAGVAHDSADPLRCPITWILHPAAFRTRKILASKTETICVSPAATATSPMPNMSSLST